MLHGTCSLRAWHACAAACTTLSCLCAPAAKIQNDLRILTERLARINDNLARKISSRNEYDKTIQETEAAYAKVEHLLSRPQRSHPCVDVGWRYSRALSALTRVWMLGGVGTVPEGSGSVGSLLRRA